MNIDGKRYRIKIFLKNGEHFYIEEQIGGRYTAKEREKKFENHIKKFEDLKAIGIEGYTGEDIGHIKFVDDKEGRIGF